MTPEQFAKQFCLRFYGNDELLKRHLSVYDEFLGHVFFGEVFVPAFKSALTAQDEKQITACVSLLQEMLTSGDEAAQNIVSATVLEDLGDEEALLRKAVAALSDELLLALQKSENLLGRRKIRLFRKRGVLIAEW